jgi:hypothetical protein
MREKRIVSRKNDPISQIGAEIPRRLRYLGSSRRLGLL